MPQGISTYTPSEIKLTETPNGVSPEVQLLRVGTFNHPKYGKFEITPLVLAEMKYNFEKNVRGIDIALDFFHESDKVAAGWLKTLELRENGTELWAINVDWTPRARKMLAEKELRYFSPDFSFQWTDPENGKVFQNVLFGGGLTNRPFVKGMEPIVSLGEDAMANEETLTETDDTIQLGGPGSGRKPGGGKGKESQYKTGAQHAKEGSARQAAIARREIEKNIGPRAGDLGASLKRNNKLDEPEGEIQMDEKDQMIEELKKQIADLQAKLEASGKEKEVMAGEKMKLEEQVKCAEEEKAKAQKESEFNVLLSEGKACVAQKDAYLAGDMKEFIAKAQPINLSEKGNGKGTEGDKTIDGDVTEQVMKLAEEKVKSGLKLGEAISAVLKENTELAKQYAGQ
jgi:hypothetical protein